MSACGKSPAATPPKSTAHELPRRSRSVPYEGFAGVAIAMGEIEDLEPRFEGQRLSLVLEELGRSDQVAHDMLTDERVLDGVPPDARILWLRTGTRRWEGGYLALLGVRVAVGGEEIAWNGYATIETDRTLEPLMLTASRSGVR
jgi:hypothetical protein